MRTDGGRLTGSAWNANPASGTTRDSRRSPPTKLDVVATRAQDFGRRETRVDVAAARAGGDEDVRQES